MSQSKFRQDALSIALNGFKNGQIDRRSFLVAMGALGLTVAVKPGNAAADANEIVICNWGGAAVDAHQEAFGKPFTAKTGIKVVVDGAGPDTAAIRAQVEANAVIWDVTDGGMTDAATLGKGGYVRPIDYSVVDKNKVGPGMAAEFGIANYVFANVLAYNSEMTKGVAPSGWSDFFDLEKFPGKRTMCKYVQGQLEAVLLADGVAPKDIYPLDLDRAFKKLKPLLPHLIFWDSGAQSQQLFRDGEVVMGNIWHSRANLLSKETKGRLTWSWDQNLLFLSAWSVPKGNPAGDKVFEFINSSLDPEGQLLLLRSMGGGPTNPKAIAMMTDEDKKVSPSTPQNAVTQFRVDPAYYAENEAEIQNKYLDFIS